jgi:hypothetical protein
MSYQHWNLPSTDNRSGNTIQGSCRAESRRYYRHQGSPPMSRADSPLRDRMIFCFGARRSGTYLVQRMVAAHPAVSAVPSETHLISHGIAPLLERFHHGVRESTQVGSVYADREVLLDAVRDLCDAAFGEYLEPGATHVVERTALHALHASLIAEIYPDAGVVHVIRDGRDAALSIMRRTWWGPDSIGEAAGEWADCVRNGRQAAEMDRYVEIRYEDLLADPAPAIERVFDRLGLESSSDAIEAALGELGVSRNVEPGDRIGTEKWREGLSTSELEAFDRIAGPTLRELGYVPSATGAAHPRPPTGAARTLESGRSRLTGLARSVRKLGGLRESRRRRAEAKIEDLASSVAIIDRLLTAAREGRKEEILRLLDPVPEVFLIAVDGKLQVETGESARRILAATLIGDPALRGRQLSGRVLPGRPITVAALELELPDGSRATRVVAIDVRNRLVKRAIVEVAEPPG